MQPLNTPHKVQGPRKPRVSKEKGKIQTTVKQNEEHEIQDTSSDRDTCQNRLFQVETVHGMREVKLTRLQNGTEQLWANQNLSNVRTPFYSISQNSGETLFKIGSHRQEGIFSIETTTVYTWKIIRVHCLV